MSDDGFAERDGQSPGPPDDVAARWAEAMRALTQAGVPSREAIFRSAARSIAILLRPEVAGVGIRDDAGEIETPALCREGAFADPIRYPAHGSPCDRGYGAGDYHHFEDVQTRFPESPILAEHGARTYFGHVIRSERGEPLGHIFAVFAVGDPPDGDIGGFLALVAGWCARELNHLETLGELRLSEQNAKRVLAEARDARNIGQDLLSMVNHEIRTPLNAIIGFSDLLRTAEFAPDRETVQSYGEMINGSGRSLLRILDRVIFANTMANPQAISCDDVVDTAELCETVRQSFLSPLEGSERVRFQIAPGAERLMGDEDAIRRLLEELLDNSLKHTTAAGRIDVEFHAQTEDGMRISVKDDGHGIPAEEVARLLLPFQQRETGYARDEMGAGLGLHLVRCVVQAHEGDIRIEQAQGGGTVVVVTLPKRSLD